MQIETIPEVKLMPKLMENLPVLDCRFGWSEQTTSVYLESDFNHLILSGGKDQNFKIPDMGPQSKKVRNLTLNALGTILGLEQFTKYINKLEIISVPKNSINISTFKELDSLSINWDNKIKAQIYSLCKLNTLKITSLKDEDLKRFNSIKNIRELHMLQGNLKSLNGVNTNLKKLSLTRVRNFEDLDSINQHMMLKELDISNLNKIEGNIKIVDYKDIELLRVVESSCLIDLYKINKAQNLTKLWLNVDHLNLDWKLLLSLPKIQIIGVYDNEITDEKIHSLAADANKNIDRLFRAGTKKKPHIQISFKTN